jgi:hypothetical protein
MKKKKKKRKRKKEFGGGKWLKSYDKKKTAT